MAQGRNITVIVGENTYSLSRWAIMNDFNPSTVLYRYNKGIRDPYQLVAKRKYTIRRKPAGITPEDLTEEDINYLRGVAQYSEGQEDHWQILADFAGLEHKYIQQLKEMLA